MIWRKPWTKLGIVGIILALPSVTLTALTVLYSIGYLLGSQSTHTLTTFVLIIGIIGGLCIAIDRLREE